MQTNDPTDVGRALEVTLENQRPRRDLYPTLSDKSLGSCLAARTVLPDKSITSRWGSPCRLAWQGLPWSLLRSIDLVFEAFIEPFSPQGLTEPVLPPSKDNYSSTRSCGAARRTVSDRVADSLVARARVPPSKEPDCPLTPTTDEDRLTVSVSHSCLMDPSIKKPSGSDSVETMKGEPAYGPEPFIVELELTSGAGRSPASLTALGLPPVGKKDTLFK